MAWFDDGFGRFFKDLKANNNRDWFQENKKRYEKEVKQPFEKFVAELIVRMQQYDAECQIEPKQAIFRIYRDVRFSKDKTPYKTHVSAIVGKNGRKSKSEDGLYVELGHDLLRVYGGIYMPDKEQLYAIRQEILYNQEEFEKVVSDSTFKKWYGEIRGEKNKRLVPEFAEIMEEQPLIANKQFYFYSELPSALLTSTDLVDEVFKAYEASIPVRQFLMAPLKDQP